MKDKLTHSVCVCVTVWHRQQWECIQDRSSVGHGRRSQSQDTAGSFPTFCAQELLPISPVSCSQPGSLNTSSQLLCLSIILRYYSSTNWRQSLFCCCTASMEQATDGAETAAIDGLVLSWSENISVSFCLRAPGYGLTLWSCALGLLVGDAIQVPQLQSHYCIIVDQSSALIPFFLLYAPVRLVVWQKMFSTEKHIKPYTIALSIRE